MVLVDQAAQYLAALDPSFPWCDGPGIVIGWLLGAGLVRPVAGMHSGLTSTFVRLVTGSAMVAVLA